MRAINRWFDEQTVFQFYSSSLLIVYEGDSAQLDEASDNDKDSDKGKQISSDVRMIDFTHVFQMPKRDENYLKGLVTLIQHIEEYEKTV